MNDEKQDLYHELEEIVFDVISQSLERQKDVKNILKLYQVHGDAKYKFDIDHDTMLTVKNLAMPENRNMNFGHYLHYELGFNKKSFEDLQELVNKVKIILI